MTEDELESLLERMREHAEWDTYIELHPKEIRALLTTIEEQCKNNSLPLKALAIMITAKSNSGLCHRL